MINPDGGGLVEGNDIFGLHGGVEFQVSDNDIADLLQSQATVGETYF